MYFYLHKYDKIFTFMTITMNTVLLKNKKFLLCGTHIFMHVLFHMLYYTVEEKNTCEITHFYHSVVKVFALLACCVA